MAAYVLPFEKPVVELVRIAHQAVIARRLTVFLCTRSMPLISTCDWIEVTNLQRCSGHVRHGLRIIQQAS